MTTLFPIMLYTKYCDCRGQPKDQVKKSGREHRLRNVRVSVGLFHLLQSQVPLCLVLSPISEDTSVSQKSYLPCRAQELFSELQTYLCASKGILIIPCEGKIEKIKK
jgi:hypothetical protein